MKYWKYLKYVIKHKYYVMLECFEMGIYWRGLTHDLSKLLPSEFIPYANYFYGESLESKESAKAKFEEAWLFHQHRNPHHWQYWILQNDSDGVKILDIPEKYILEMFCDWVGAGKAITGKRDVINWWDKNKEVILLSDKTTERIEELMDEERIRAVK